MVTQNRSAWGRPRRFQRAPLTSGPPRSTDIFSRRRDVSIVPIDFNFCTSAKSAIIAAVPMRSSTIMTCFLFFALVERHRVVAPTSARPLPAAVPAL
jgi:hypothetical protein